VAKALAILLILVSYAGVFRAFMFCDMHSDVLSAETYSESYYYKDKFQSYIMDVVECTRIDRLKAGADSGTGTDQKSEEESENGSGNESDTVSEVKSVDGAVIDSSPDQNSFAFAMIKQRELDKSVNFKYAVINTATNEYETNIALGGDSVQKAAEKLLTNKSWIYYSAADNKFNYSNLLIREYLKEDFFDYIGSELGNGPIVIYAAIQDELVPGDEFYDIKQDFESSAQQIMEVMLTGASAVFVGILCFIYLVSVAGRKQKEGPIEPALIDWFYTDIHTLITVLIITASIGITDEIIHSLGSQTYQLIFMFIVSSLDFMVLICYSLSMIRHIKRKTLFRHTLTYNLLKAVRRLFGNFLGQIFRPKALKPVIILLILAYGWLNVIFTIIMVNSGNGVLAFLIILGLNMVVIYYSSKALKSLMTIMKWVNEMSRGNLDVDLEVDRMSRSLVPFANDIGCLQTGLKEAVKEAVKGERLKTELITNVSHDLKTPLTSIINYVDLLKKEKTDNETIKEYVDVLEEKSARLKKLIDDLLEASKAASGNMNINLGDIDLCQLCEQSTAEFSDKTEKAGLDVRMKLSEKPTVVRGDGALMWRIMDNLLSNVVKYAQKNSRVYINIEETDGYGTITVKNISEAPLDISAEQLMERFVRGDKSRTTEGSGLGLSIAKSLAEAQHGRLELSVDGDLFKVIVKIPIVKAPAAVTPIAEEKSVS
jgi:signal transduction histidine kinase